MTYERKYTKEQLIVLARERDIYPPENATDEELKVVERRLSAERGWLGEPPPEHERTPPSHASKWYKMMGAAKLLPGACKAEESDGRP
jgi:hypothetical protein